MKSTLPIVFLWHQHQPHYLDPKKDQFILPWVRLHALKDYYDMAAYIDAVPGARAVINLVPSLWKQLEAFIEGAEDTWLEVARRRVDQWSTADRNFAIEHFLGIHAEHLIGELPHYQELQQQRFCAPQEICEAVWADRFDEQDLIDVVVLFHLAWCGETLKQDPWIKGLIAKGRSYTEEEKQQLLQLQHDFLSRIGEIHQRLAREGRVELSTTPWYHPILPLVINIQSGREMLPSNPFPEEKFTWPNDAETQLKRSIRFMTEFSGENPGFWPSEGSLSQSVLEMAARLGIPWLASDEMVLANSLDKSTLNPTEKYRAWEFHRGEQRTCLFFRDHELSDLIGFTYANLPPDQAVEDFVHRLEKIYASLPADKSSFLVSVILDGENAWEFYPDNGRPFLTALYRRLVEHPSFELTTFRDYLQSNPVVMPLQHLRAGSWIYGTLSTWIGQAEKNRAWNYLARVRRFLHFHLQDHELSEEKLAQVMEHIYVAEGSDWFWWYGDDHFTVQQEEFDRLFRGHLQAVYQRLGLKPPAFLDFPIRSEEAASALVVPLQVINPDIDGRVTHYYERIAAGRILPRFGAIQQVDTMVAALYFGVNDQSLFFRIDPEAGSEQRFATDIEIDIDFPDLETRVTFSPVDETARTDDHIVGRCRFQQVFEGEIKWRKAGLPEDRVVFRVIVRCGMSVVEVLPVHQSAEVDLNVTRVISDNWFV